MIEDSLVKYAPEPPSNWQASLRSGGLILFFTFFILGTWSAIARVDSAVVATGSVSVESYRKTVQHLEGGIVSELLVRDGAVVKEGDVLLRLDPTRTAANDSLVKKQLVIALAHEARLLAERDMKDKVTFPQDVEKFAADPVVAAAINDNKTQFNTRRDTLMSSLDVITKQTAQAQNDIEQAVSDKTTATAQLNSIRRELPPIRQLFAKGLVPVTRVLTLERTEQQYVGAAAKADIDLSRAKERILELKSKHEQTRQDYSQLAAQGLTEVRKAISDASQQSLVSQDALKRIDIKAPVSGTVQQLRIFTVGGVVRPGEPILDVVPESNIFVVRARVSPLDVDRITAGQRVEIRLPQFQTYHNEVIYGNIRTISRDSIVDVDSKLPYFAVEVAVDRTSMPKMVAEKMTAGMTTDVIMPTEQRTVLQFIVSPFLNRIHVSMRER